MITGDTFFALTAGENIKRRNLLEAVHTSVDEVNKCRIALLNCKEQVRWLNERIQYCKKYLSSVDKAIFDPMRKELWEFPSLLDPIKDFSIGAKCYAYLLYYRQQMNNLQKIIKKLKAEFLHQNKTLSKKQNELNDYDGMLNTKYAKINNAKSS